jgi:hypothetical protein
MEVDVSDGASIGPSFAEAPTRYPCRHHAPKLNSVMRVHTLSMVRQNLYYPALTNTTVMTSFYHYF